MPTKVDRSTPRQRVARRLEGQRFGRLVVVRYAGQHVLENGHTRSLWECRCDCSAGNVVTVRQDKLLLRVTTSCGCVRRDGLRARQSQLRWAHKRRVEFQQIAVLWRPYGDLLKSFLEVKAIPRGLIEARWPGPKLVVRELVDLVRLPTEREAADLAVVLHLRGMDRVSFEGEARKAREAVTAYAMKQEWALARVREARGEG